MVGIPAGSGCISGALCRLCDPKKFKARISLLGIILAAPKNKYGPDADTGLAFCFGRRLLIVFFGNCSDRRESLRSV